MRRTNGSWELSCCTDTVTQTVILNFGGATGWCTHLKKARNEEMAPCYGRLLLNREGKSFRGCIVWPVLLLTIGTTD